jgi:hypothetical protein
MEFSVRPIRACLLQGTVSMGNRPRGGGGSTGRGMEQPAAPVSCASPKTSFHASSRPTPASLSHLPSMPSRKKPHHAAVTRGIPHEDGGSIFIQIPVTPPESVHGLDTERFIKPVRHWFDGLYISHRTAPVPALCLLSPVAMATGDRRSPFKIGKKSGVWAWTLTRSAAPR